MCKIKILRGFTVSREISALQNIVGGGRRSSRKNRPGSSPWLDGFTLIELLVVIAIIGILGALLTTNFIAARDRAYDAKGKGNLQAVKTALHSYYINYRKYPTTNLGVYLNACGTSGTEQCGNSFTAGGIIYMDKLPKSGSFNEFKYYQCEGGDDFRITYDLKNKSDPDIAESKLKCPACGGASYAASPTYVLCGTQ